MAFKRLVDTNQVGVSFNSTTSSNFKDMYENILKNKYEAAQRHKPSQTFAPSSFYCDRLSYFRIRGVEPDPISNIDYELEFSAEVGTACHQNIQANLILNIGDNWIRVSDYLNSANLKHSYRISSEDEYEARIEFTDPPVKFGCDGLINIGGTIFILEIKTVTTQSFAKLSEPKPQHIDQIKCYCALLELNDVLFLYQDRVTGKIKCYQLNVKQYEIDEIYDRMSRVMHSVETNLVPPKLSTGDYRCSYCKYKQRCKQWG